MLVVGDSVVAGLLHVEDDPLVVVGQVWYPRLCLRVLEPRLDACVVEVRRVLARVGERYPPRAERVTSLSWQLKPLLLPRIPNGQQEKTNEVISKCPISDWRDLRGCASAITWYTVAEVPDGLLVTVTSG